LNELKNLANLDIKTILVGNKCNLEERIISKEEGENF
jgi:GTPase SAR1 family protein